MLLVYEKYFFRVNSYASLTVLLTEQGETQTAQIVSSGGGDGGFRSERILAWLDPEGHSQGKGFQTLQALYAIGSGGIFGKGLGQSMQKLSFLPEAQNDMIFSIICEELGLFGAIAVILMFIMLLWRMMVMRKICSEPCWWWGLWDILPFRRF